VPTTLTPEAQHFQQYFGHDSSLPQHFAIATTHLLRDEFLEHYHQRSNAESTFSAIKRKLGGAVRSKTSVAQKNEVLCKVLAYNLTVLVHAMHELGVEPEFWEAA
jgi:hypothetical protein